MLLMHGPAAHYWDDLDSKVVFSRYWFPRFLKLANHAEMSSNMTTMTLTLTPSSSAQDDPTVNIYINYNKTQTMWV